MLEWYSLYTLKTDSMTVRYSSRPMVRVRIAGKKMKRDYLGMEVSLIRLDLEYWLWLRPFLWLG